MKLFSHVYKAFSLQHVALTSVNSTYLLSLALLSPYCLVQASDLARASALSGAM